MKILLVNTNLMRPPVAPLGLDYLADSLRAAGHEPALLDLCFSTDVDADIDAACRGTPDAIGCTVRNTDDCYFASGEFFLPKIRGIISSAATRRRRPGRRRRRGLFRDAGSGCRAAAAPTTASPARAKRHSSGSSVRSPPTPRRAGEGHLPGPGPRLPRRDRHSPHPGPRHRPRPAAGPHAVLRRQSAVLRRRRPGGLRDPARVPLSCSYCADPVAKGHRTRLLPPRRVVAEIEALVGLGIDHLHTCDPEFNVPLAHARDVCRAMIEAGLAEKVRWYAYCSPMPFDDATAALMKRAGCAGIDFGADSGSDRMLQRLGRHYRAADLESTARSCRKAGIPFMYDLLLGGPDETPDSLRESLDFIRGIGPDCVGISLGVRIYRAPRSPPR
ncbi:MAG: radical SAM protein [Comamonadaceae bacterium]|nr:radical SAM protein [Comamonadaceae bacterium]